MNKKKIKKRISNEEIWDEDFFEMFQKLLESNLSTRILSEDEKQHIPKEALNYIFKLKKELYIDEAQFEKIMLLSTVISDIAGTEDNYNVYYDIVNFIYFIDNTDLYIPEILEMMLSGLDGEYFNEKIN